MTALLRILVFAVFVSSIAWPVHAYVHGADTQAHAPAQTSNDESSDGPVHDHCFHFGAHVMGVPLTACSSGTPAVLLATLFIAPLFHSIPHAPVGDPPWV